MTERKRLETQLRQAQKMQAIGTLREVLPRFQQYLVNRAWAMLNSR